jgi:hypothetical protein
MKVDQQDGQTGLITGKDMQADAGADRRFAPSPSDPSTPASAPRRRHAFRKKVNT